MKEKVGVAIVTCNRPDFLRNLLNTLVPCSKFIDELVVVNDGAPITDINLDQGVWLDNPTNLGVGKSKNRGMQYLLNKGCDYIFVIEDDMLIKDSTIFEAYINAYKITGIHHFMFAYHGPGNKGGISGGKPQPRKIIDYGKLKISLNQHCVGAFCFYTRKCLEDVGLNDENYTNAFEHVDHSYVLAKKGYSTPYWWWADLADSLNYINEQACSEVSSSIKPRSDWQSNIFASFKYFYTKHNITPVEVRDSSINEVIEFLKKIK